MEGNRKMMHHTNIISWVLMFLTRIYGKNSFEMITALQLKTEKGVLLKQQPSCRYQSIFVWPVQKKLIEINLLTRKNMFPSVYKISIYMWFLIKKNVSLACCENHYNIIWIFFLLWNCELIIVLYFVCRQKSLFGLAHKV